MSEIDPAERLRRQLDQISAESDERQRVFDAENDRRLQELGVEAQATLDGLARSQKESDELPKMDRSKPDPTIIRLSDLI